MTNDEAARLPDGERADGANAAAAPPPATPPRNERPRPRYGEYAPEGWTWTPPAKDPYSGTSSLDPDAEADAGAPGADAARAANTWGEVSRGAPGPAGAVAPARPADRGWTIALLVLGALGAIYNCLVIVSFPSNVLESAKLTAEMLGTPAPTEFTPGPGVPVAIAIGVMAQLVLWLGAFIWSRSRMRAGATSWWIPLIAGVVAFIVMLIVSMVVLASDPALLELLQSARTQAG